MAGAHHILVVDDDREIRDLVKQLLESHGFRVSMAADGSEMRRLLGDRKIDLLVLDLMLPFVDGLALCRELRANAIMTPVVMLTAKGDEIDRVLGLEMGADDYLAKPFSGRELVARIRAVLRRARPPGSAGGGPPARVYRFGDWTLHAARRELESTDDVLVPLSTGEYNLLMALVERPCRVLSREQLVELAHGRPAGPLDRSIDIQVSRLRRKLGDDGKNPRMIKTVRGGGYLFVGPVARE